MKKNLAIQVCLAGLLALLAWPMDGSGQGFGPGGGGRGGRGGFRQGGGGGGMDAGSLFDRLSQGQPALQFSEAKFFQQPLTEWAQQNGISGTAVTKEQFVAFFEALKAAKAANKGNIPWGNRQQNGQFAPPGMQKQGASESPADRLKRWALWDFQRRDQNGDGFLNTDEVPEGLKEDLPKWDTNGDSLIDFNEYYAYLLARSQVTQDATAKGIDPAQALLDEELDRRPTVYRAGKLPEKLPTWFKELDTDKDGQVGLYEWRAAGRPIEDFKKMDRNDDGYLTAEEVLRYQVVVGGPLAAPPTQVASVSNNPEFQGAAAGPGAGPAPGPGPGWGRRPGGPGGIGPGGPGMGMFRKGPRQQ